MLKFALSGAILAIAFCAFGAPTSHAAAISTPLVQADVSTPALVQLVGKKKRKVIVAPSRGAIVVGPRIGGPVVRGPVVRGPVVVGTVRPFVRRPHYGTVLGSIALGTIIATTVAPVAPRPDVCWYWADPYRTSGYYDYC